jgi:hypothetical protein
LTLRINTSRCERTRTHFLNSIRAGERQYGIPKGNGVYYSFTLQAAQSGSRFHPPHFAGVCTVRITGLGSAGNPLPIVNRFLTLSAVTK